MNNTTCFRLQKTFYLLFDRIYHLTTHNISYVLGSILRPCNFKNLSFWFYLLKQYNLILLPSCSNYLCFHGWGQSLICGHFFSITIALQSATILIFFASNMQALFRALKTKHATPKYGLIFHASLIGHAAPKLKGKIARSLAAKTALAIWYDAFGDSQDNTLGLENRAKVTFVQETATMLSCILFVLSLVFIPCVCK